MYSSSSYSSSSFAWFTGSWLDVGSRRLPQILQTSASTRTTLSHCGQVVSCWVGGVDCINATIPPRKVLMLRPIIAHSPRVGKILLQLCERVRSPHHFYLLLY